MPVYKEQESTWAGPMEDDSMFVARITGIKEVERDKWEDGQKTDEKITRVEFSFIVDDPDSAWDGQKLWGDTPTTFVRNDKCKLRNWAKEILGVDDFPEGFELNTDDLVGESVRVIVGAREYEKDGEKKVHNSVKDLIRSSAKMGSRAVDALDDEPF